MKILILSILAVVPGIAFAAIVPCNGPDCVPCDFALLAQNILTFLITVGVILGAIMFAIAGFMLLTSAGDMGKVEKAKGLFANVLIGLIVVLAAWLMIDTVMKVFLSDSIEQEYGPWNEVVCSFSVDSRHVANTGNGGLNTGSADPGTGGPLPQCTSGSGACSVSALQDAGMSKEQANIMSCIAMTESSGNPSAQSNGSSACGTFQIIKGTWDAYATGACRGHTAQCTNASCNAQVAASLVDANGYSDWTCPDCNARADNCVQKYSL